MFTDFRQFFWVLLDFDRTDREMIARRVLPMLDDVDGPRAGSLRRGVSEAVADSPGWIHDVGNCQGCQQPAPAWHLHRYDGVVAKVLL